MLEHDVLSAVQAGGVVLIEAQAAVRSLAAKKMQNEQSVE